MKKTLSLFLLLFVLLSFCLPPAVKAQNADLPQLAQKELEALFRADDAGYFVRLDEEGKNPEIVDALNRLIYPFPADETLRLYQAGVFVSSHENGFSMKKADGTLLHEWSRAVLDEVAAVGGKWHFLFHFEDEDLDYYQLADDKGNTLFDALPLRSEDGEWITAVYSEDGTILRLETEQEGKSAVIDDRGRILYLSEHDGAELELKNGVVMEPFPEDTAESLQYSLYRYPGKERIKMGIFEPFSGDMAYGGESTLMGIKLAFRQKPMLLGHPVELIPADIQSDQMEAVNAAERLVFKDKVHAVLGSFRSEFSLPAGDVFLAAEIPAVSGASTNPLVTQGNPWYFRVCFVDAFQGTVMAQFANEHLQAKSAVILTDKNRAYSVGLAKFFKDAFETLNGEGSVMAELSYKSGDQDFSALLNRIRELAPDVVFLPGNLSDSAGVIRAARSSGLELPFLGGDVWDSQELINLVGEDAARAVYFSTHFSPQHPVNETAQHFLDEFRAEYDREPDAFAALGYDAYMLVADAIDRAGTYEAEALRRALEETTDFNGVTGMITMDDNGNPIKEAYVYELQGQEFTFVTAVRPDRTY